MQGNTKEAKMKKKTVIVLEMILIFAITILLIFLLQGNDTLVIFIKIFALTLLLWLSGQLRKAH